MPQSSTAAFAAALAACALSLPLLCAPAFAAPSGVAANRGACASGDSACLSGGSRQAASTAVVGEQAANATAGCIQGKADSSCALPIGAARPSYSQGLTSGGPIACYNYGASQYYGSCPSGQVGTVIMRQDYACAWRTTTLPNGTLTSTYSEPGSWSGAYQVYNDCYTPAPPAPARQLWVATMYPGGWGDTWIGAYLPSRTMYFCSASKPGIYLPMMPVSMTINSGNTLQYGSPPCPLGCNVVDGRALKDVYRTWGNITDYWFSWSQAGGCDSPYGPGGLDPYFFDVY